MRYGLNIYTLFTLPVSGGLGCAMAHAVSPWLVSALVWVRSKVRPCDFCGGQCGTDTGGFPGVCDFPCLYHSTNAPYASSNLHAAVTRMTKDRAQGNFQKHCCFWNCGALDRKLLSSFKGLISSEGKPAVSVCREQMASNFGLALPHVEPNPSPSSFTCNPFTEPTVCWRCIEACNAKSGVTVTETRETQMSFGAAPRYL